MRHIVTSSLVETTSRQMPSCPLNRRSLAGSGWIRKADDRVLWRSSGELLMLIRGGLCFNTYISCLDDLTVMYPLLCLIFEWNNVKYPDTQICVYYWQMLIFTGSGDGVGAVIVLGVQQVVVPGGGRRGGGGGGSSRGGRGGGRGCRRLLQPGRRSAEPSATSPLGTVRLGAPNPFVQFCEDSCRNFYYLILRPYSM